MTPRITLIGYSKAAFAPILAEAESANGGCMLRLRDEWLSGAQRFDQPDEFLLGRHVGDLLAGVGGVSHDPYSPQPHLGRVRHIYVLQRLRRQGTGRALMTAIIARAGQSFEVLRLRTRSPEGGGVVRELWLRAEPRRTRDSPPHPERRLRRLTAAFRRQSVAIRYRRIHSCRCKSSRIMSRKIDQIPDSAPPPPHPATGLLFLTGGLGLFYAFISIVDPLL